MTERVVDPGVIWTIARKEIRDALGNRWFMLYGIAFAVLASAVSSLSLAGTETFGFVGYGRTGAGLINLIILFVPLMALTAGAGAIAGERERGTLGYLLSQPISRFELLAGKYLGLAVALLSALAAGFGFSALVASRQHVNAADLALLAALSGVLALAMLSVGMLISTMTRRTGAALGTAIVLWLVLALLGDLGLMSSTLVFKIPVDDLFRLSMLNPLQVYKMAALNGIHASLDVLGPAGLWALRNWGETLPWLFGAALGGWTIAPLALAAALFCRRADT